MGLIAFYTRLNLIEFQGMMTLNGKDVTFFMTSALVEIDRIIVKDSKQFPF